MPRCSSWATFCSTGTVAGSRLRDVRSSWTSREFDLLAYFARHPNIVLSRERLLDRVWGVHFPGGTRTVDVHVGQLRRKLDRPSLIKTSRGAGDRATAC